MRRTEEDTSGGFITLKMKRHDPALPKAGTTYLQAVTLLLFNPGGLVLVEHLVHIYGEDGVARVVTQI